MRPLRGVERNMPTDYKITFHLDKQCSPNSILARHFNGLDHWTNYLKVGGLFGTSSVANYKYFVVKKIDSFQCRNTQTINDHLAVFDF